MPAPLPHPGLQCERARRPPGHSAHDGLWAAGVRRRTRAQARGLPGECSRCSRDDRCQRADHLRIRSRQDTKQGCRLDLQHRRQPLLRRSACRDGKARHSDLPRDHRAKRSVRQLRLVSGQHPFGVDTLLLDTKDCAAIFDALTPGLEFRALKLFRIELSSVFS